MIHQLNTFDDKTELENILFIRIIFVDPENLKQVQEFYWGHSNQNKTSARILEIVKSYI
jgi:hypothetical protein